MKILNKSVLFLICAACGAQNDTMPTKEAYSLAVAAYSCGRWSGMIATLSAMGGKEAAIGAQQRYDDAHCLATVRLVERIMRENMEVLK